MAATKTQTVKARVQATPRKPQEDPVQVVLEGIALGRHDEKLVDIHNTIKARVLQVDGAIVWGVDLPDLKVEPGRVSLSTLERLEDLSDLGGSVMYVSPTSSAKLMGSYLRVLYEQSGMTAEQAKARVEELTLDEAMGAFVDEVQIVPKAQEVPPHEG